MRSVQLRLSLGIVASLIVAFSILCWMASAALRYVAENHRLEHLQHDMEGILSGVTVEADHSIQVDLRYVEPVFLREHSGQYFWVVGDKNTIHSPSLGNYHLSTPPVSENQMQRFSIPGPEEQPLRVLSKGFNLQGVNLTISLAEDLSSTNKLISQLQLYYWLVSAILLLLLVAIQIGLLRSGFRPMSRIAKQLRELERGDRKQLDMHVLPETAGLVGEVNHLLRVLDQRLQQSRNALADLAHSLKTPLTVIKQLANQDNLDNPEDLASLRRQITNMHKMIDRVLKRARLASNRTKSKFDIRLELEDLVDAMRCIHRDKGLVIMLNIPNPRTIFVDREDMLELAGNLIDNACKWADHQVKVRISLNGFMQLVVEDDGPGVASTEISTLSTRGARLDEAVTGYGLGLSIARFICEQHGGELNFSRSASLGGFCVTATLAISESKLFVDKSR